MRALWSDRQNCSHKGSQKVKRSRRFSEREESSGNFLPGCPGPLGVFKKFVHTKKIVRIFRWLVNQEVHIVN